MPSIAASTSTEFFVREHTGRWTPKKTTKINTKEISNLKKDVADFKKQSTDFKKEIEDLNEAKKA